MIHIFVLLFSLFTSTAHAHVGYVVSQNDFAANLGADPQYFFGALSNPLNIAMILGTLLGVFVLYFLAWRIKPVRNWIIALRMRLDGYTDFVPWILRLSLGIAFIGASVAGVLISPTLPNAGFAALQLAVGFALLAGFAVVPAVLAGIVLFMIAIFEKAYIIGNLEFGLSLVALLILGDARPGVDDLFGVPVLKLPRLKAYIPLLLRLGIGGALVFLALYEKVLNPHVSRLVVDAYGLNSIIPVGADMWVFAVGMIELAVGLFILIGFQTRLVTAIAFLVLVTTFFFFKEEVYSHVTLFGVLSALLVTGGGAWSLDYLLKKRS